LKEFLIFIIARLLQQRKYAHPLKMAGDKEWTLLVYKHRSILFIDGTRTSAEWLNNFKKNGWEKSAKEIKAAYEKKWILGPPDYIVGFSRGGPIALYLGSIWEVPKVICISSPKASKNQLLLNGIPLFIELENDLVSWIPPFFTKPSPYLMLKVPGWRHGIVKMLDIPDWKIKLIENALAWDIPDDASIE
jgi:hypothetical protein